MKHPYLIDSKSIKHVNYFINRQTLSDNYIKIYRYYRNLLKACRILGVDEAFEEFETPDIKYLNVFNTLLRSECFNDLIVNTALFKDTISSNYIRNILHNYQAKYENDLLMRNELIALWEYISGFQTLKRQVWFWE